MGIPRLRLRRPSRHAGRRRRSLHRLGFSSEIQSASRSMFKMFMQILLDAGVKISTDGRGPWMDKAFVIKRFWRT